MHVLLFLLVAVALFMSSFAWYRHKIRQAGQTIPGDRDSARWLLIGLSLLALLGFGALLVYILL
jgi:hypothetical protein